LEKLAREGRIDLAATFDRLPTPFMILDRTLSFVGMNQAYLETVGRTRDALIGQYIFDVFPNQGESRRLLQESLEAALRTGKTAVLPLIEYAIERPAEQGGGLETRYWSATHTPAPGDDGEISYVIQHTQDVTEMHRLRRGQDAHGAAALPQAILSRAQTAQAEVTELRRLFDEAPGFMAVLRGPDHVFEWCNKAYNRLIGDRPVVGLSVSEAVPEFVAQGYIDVLDSVLRTREPYVARSAAVMLQDGVAGPMGERYLDFSYQPIISPGGEVEGIFVQGSDVTEATRLLQQQRLLLDELNHRVKNTLATVQSIAVQTLRTSRSPAEFTRQLQSRIRALAETHSALTDTLWRGASLTEMLRRELSPYGEEAVRIEGPEIMLPPRMALPFGLVFHEMATNAAKYGALSTPQGRLSVTWRLSDDTPDRPSLEFDWTEQGGPTVEPPMAQGFGGKLIERTLTAELNGRAQIDYRPQGLHCTLTAPLEPVTA